MTPHSNRLNRQVNQRRLSVTLGFAAVALCASGCGNGPAPERTPTKVLRPDEVKISLGSKAVPAAGSAENEAKASPAAPATESKP